MKNQKSAIITLIFLAIITAMMGNTTVTKNKKTTASNIIIDA